MDNEISVDVILECLWAIRDKDKFYFVSYGKDMIEEYLKKNCSPIPPVHES